MSLYRSVSTCLLTAGLGAMLACGPAFGAEPQFSPAKPQTVVFVCKYGSVKSLIATERFNKVAEMRGLNIRAISRAANPGTMHDEVPPLVARQLALEGIDVSKFQPKIVTPEEAASAIRIVHISLQGETDPDSSVAASVNKPETRWNDVPSLLKASDASGNPTGAVDETGAVYQKSRAPLVSHVDALVDELAKQSGTPTN
jgi:protein-tyrosine-phosphatase